MGRLKDFCRLHSHSRERTGSSQVNCWEGSGKARPSRWSALLLLKFGKEIDCGFFRWQHHNSLSSPLPFHKKAKTPQEMWALTFSTQDHKLTLLPEIENNIAKTVNTPWCVERNRLLDWPVTQSIISLLTSNG